MCVLKHPQYSPDLDACDYIIFPKTNLELKGRDVVNIDDTEQAVTSN